MKLRKESSEYLFARTFLITSWNLLCRAGNTVSIHLRHLSWDGDALAIRFGHMKNDQEGIRPRDARHVMPEISPILSLAMYGTAWGFSPVDARLFLGENQYYRFSKILRRLMTEASMVALWRMKD